MEKDTNKKAETTPRKTFFVETEDVAQEIANVAISKKIPQKMLDFNIINYRTYYKERGKEDREWIELDKDNLYKLGDDDFLLKKNIKFKQQYNLEFFLKSEAKEFPLDVTIGANKLLTKVVATIKQNLDNADFETKRRSVEEIIKFVEIKDNEIILNYAIPLRRKKGTLRKAVEK